jgi:hypothetical protein
VIFSLSSGVGGEVQKSVLFFSPILAFSIVPFI